MQSKQETNEKPLSGETSEQAFNSKEAGLDLIQNNQYEKALDAFEHALQLELDYAAALSLKAWALYKLQRYEEARSTNERARALDPTGLQSNHLTLQGWICFGLAQYHEALLAFEQALREGGDTYDAFAYEGMGQTLVQLQRDQEALDAFAKALELEPDYQEVVAARNDVLTRMQR